MKIFPSVLESTSDTLWSQLEMLSHYFTYMQIDIADGIFVPNKTVQIEDIVATVSQHAKYLANVDFEFHLMVHDVAKAIEQLEKLEGLSIKRILYHAKAFPHYFETVKDTGIVLNPEDSVEQYFDLIQQFPVVQLMTVTPGAQGNPFIPEVLLKINELRDHHYQGWISLDGGLNDETVVTILKNSSQPDFLFPGKYLRENTEQHLQTLQELIS